MAMKASREASAQVARLIAGQPFNYLIALGRKADARCTGLNHHVEPIPHISSVHIQWSSSRGAETLFSRPVYPRTADHTLNNMSRLD